MPEAPLALRRARKSRVWFWRPQRSFDWTPLRRGHDEYSRWTLVVGWPFTGRAIIALGYCGDQECHDESMKWLAEGVL